MRVSVVIPAYNEEDCIETCIQALQANTQSPDEIIVVDGGSRDRTVALARGCGVTVLNNPRRHAAAGRNIGIAQAQGDIIAFTDADCIPAPDWIEALTHAFASEPLDGLGGYVEPAPPRNDVERFWGVVSLQQVMSFGQKPYYVQEQTLNDGFITCNCAYTSKLLADLAGFDEWFANNAEDIDLSWRALQSGARLKYVPAVKIQARSPVRFRAMLKKSFRNGVASSKLQKRYGRKINFDRQIYSLLFQNLIGLFTNRPDARWFCWQLLMHLLGKYYGSLRVGVINI